MPPVSELHLVDTHRLIPSKYSQQGTVFSRLSGDDATLNDLMELDGATNDRLLGEEGLLPGIGVHELLYGVRYAHIVNAAFTHASPMGGRFNGSDRGAWYCGMERETSVAEVAFHKLKQLEEIDWDKEEISAFDDYLADFATEMHDLRGNKTKYARFLKPGPIPECYESSQKLASTLLAQQSNGVIYPSVRNRAGTCVACFRPTLVYNVRLGDRLEMRLMAGREFDARRVREMRMASGPLPGATP
jgi:RES domain-containing protein